MSLKLDWCSHEAAKYAVEHWHYSKSLPTPPIVKVGVWEDGKYIGCVLFSRGGNNNMLKPYGLEQIEGCELTRVALTAHKSPVSRIVAVAIKMLRKIAPGLRLIVSYADPNHGHNGSIYQAGGWLYVGQTSADVKYIDRTGRTWHSRQVSSTGVSRQYGEARRVPRHDECKSIPLLGKYRYLMPLDDEMRQRILPLSKPYPKKISAVGLDSEATSYVVSDTTGPEEEGGASPTIALQCEPCPAQRN